MRATGARTWLSMACVLLALAGCSVLGDDPVREQWEERQEATSCGEVVLELGERLQQSGRSGVACLRAAFESGEWAELKVVSFTDEGDPITRYYRISADRTTEVYTDSTEDQFGDQSWSFASCEHPRSALDVSC